MTSVPPALAESKFSASLVVFGWAANHRLHVNASGKLRARSEKDSVETLSGRG